MSNGKCGYPWDTVDGRNPANQLIGTRSLSHYLQGFLYVRWCRISAINRSTLKLYISVFLAFCHFIQ